MESRIEIQVPIGVCRVRLEDFLLDHFGGLSKMYLRDVVKGEACQVNGRIENVGYRLRTNDLIEIVVDETRETSMRPENIPLDVVFEDEWIIVVNKPAGMLAHPSHRENTGTLLNALAYYLNVIEEGGNPNGSEGAQGAVFTASSNLPKGRVSALIRPGLPHRLDKQTSGLIVIAKTPLAHRRVSASFMKKRVAKRYLALVNGIVERDEGTIDAPIGRYAEIKHWSVKEDGKHAVTRYWVRERYADTTLIELEPVTGRTNQLRIHCESIGHPIVGDTRRGGSGSHRLCLHAWQLAFPHPSDNRTVAYESNVTFCQ